MKKEKKKEKGVRSSYPACSNSFENRAWMHAVPFGPLKSQASVRFRKEGHKVNAQRNARMIPIGRCKRQSAKARLKMWDDPSLRELFIIGFSSIIFTSCVCVYTPFFSRDLHEFFEFLKLSNFLRFLLDCRVTSPWCRQFAALSEMEINYAESLR